MSSLRLALKQSLQDAGGDNAVPNPRPRPDHDTDQSSTAVTTTTTDQATTKKRDHHSSHKHTNRAKEDEDDGSHASSEENEASLEDLDDDPSHHHRNNNNNNNTSSSSGSSEDEDDSERTHATTTTTTPEDQAAYKIQEHFRTKTQTTHRSRDPPRTKSHSSISSNSSSGGGGGTSRTKPRKPRASSDTHNDSHDEKDTGRSEGTCSWTVDPPSAALRHYLKQSLSMETLRANVQPGLRVKVQFDRAHWYGGCIRTVLPRSEDGGEDGDGPEEATTKVQIQYDDGTSEVTAFSHDIVVDDTGNGRHDAVAKEAWAVFLPRPTPHDPEQEDAPSQQQRAQQQQQQQQEQPPLQPAQTATTKSESTDTTRRVNSEEEGEVSEGSQTTTVEAPVAAAAVKPAPPMEGTASATVDASSLSLSPNAVCPDPSTAEQQPLPLSPTSSTAKDDDDDDNKNAPPPPLAPATKQDDDKDDAQTDAKRKRGRPRKLPLSSSVPDETPPLDVGRGGAESTKASLEGIAVETSVQSDGIDVDGSSTMKNPHTEQTTQRNRDDPNKADVNNDGPTAAAADMADASTVDAAPATKPIPQLKIRMPKGTADGRKSKSPRTPSFETVVDGPLPDGAGVGATASGEQVHQQSSPVTKKLSIRIPVHKVKQTLLEKQEQTPTSKMDVDTPADTASDQALSLETTTAPDDNNKNNDTLETTEEIPKESEPDTMDTAKEGDGDVVPKTTIESKAESSLPSSAAAETVAQDMPKAREHSAVKANEDDSPASDIDMGTRANIEPTANLDGEESAPAEKHPVDQSTGTGDDIGSTEMAPPEPKKDVADPIADGAMAASQKSSTSTKQMKKLKKKKAQAAAKIQEALRKKKIATGSVSKSDATSDPVAMDVMDVESSSKLVETIVNAPSQLPQPSGISDTGEEDSKMKKECGDKDATAASSSLPQAELAPAPEPSRRSSGFGDEGYPLDGPMRMERRAAQQANERIVSKQEVAQQEQSSKREKKRKRRKDLEANPSERAGEEDDDSQWVQCDKCGKWRIIPSVVVKSLPKQWFCSDNVHDPKRASCDAPEQTQKQVAKEKKKMKKRQKMMKAAAAAAAAGGDATGTREDKEAPLQREKSMERVRSPKPPKESRGEDAEKPPKQKRASPVNDAPTAEATKERTRKEKKPVSGRKGRSGENAEPIEPVPEVVKRGRGRPRRRNAVKESDDVPVVAGDDADNLEWVQCEKCEKWRKLPPHISADQLPDVWTCSLNDWNPSSASCDAPEDKADGLQDVGVFGSSGSGAGKLTYRNLIFGSTGRKANRPISERTRAAESIFSTQFNEDEIPSKVLYSDSSAFISRGRPTVSADETESMSVLELMSHSHLWQELRTTPHALSTIATVASTSKSATALAACSFDSLSPDVQESVKVLLLQSLSSETLSRDDVVRRVQMIDVSVASESRKEAHYFCTENVLIVALCELVQDGKVECLQSLGTNWSMQQWNPRYRKTIVRPALLSSSNQEERSSKCAKIRKKSRCIKISKPWKRAASTM